MKLTLISVATPSSASGVGCGWYDAVLQIFYPSVFGQTRTLRL